MTFYRERGRVAPGVIAAGDLDLIARPIDFLGLNYYTTVTIAAGGEEGPEPGPGSDVDPELGHTDMGWRVDPDGLSRYLRHLSDTYQPSSILVTENGASYSDQPDENGVVDDPRRIDYLRSHVLAVAEARAAGVPVDGYVVWTLMDNLEWVEGFSQRFGLVWVDQTTLTRVPKRSFDWYADLARTGTLTVS